MKIKVTFIDIVEADSLEDAYDQMVAYCGDIFHNSDVSAFEFEEIKETDPITQADYSKQRA